ncbi:MAG TPA: hypothetical protein VNV87_00300, partial [Acidimicrobiales bacterium]|nr:hypothetical protein [Acidimicrobiales bacterium]
MPNPGPAGSTFDPNTPVLGGHLSFYDVLGFGISAYSNGPNGPQIVLEPGVGEGGSAWIGTLPGSQVPTQPGFQASSTFNIMDGAIRGSGSLSVPFSQLGSPGQWTMSGNAGFGIDNTILPNIRGGFVGSWDNGIQWGPTQYSLTNNIFSSGAQFKGTVRIPIPLNLDTPVPLNDGVVEHIVPQGEGTAATWYSRDVSNLGLPMGNGNTFTVNPDGSVTTHTPTADVTLYGQGWQSAQGDQSSSTGSAGMGTLTHQLLDPVTGQPSDQWTWHGQDGSTIARNGSNGQTTQTTPDGWQITNNNGQLSYTAPDGSSVWTTNTGAVVKSDNSVAITWNSDGSTDLTFFSPIGDGIPVTIHNPDPSQFSGIDMTRPTIPGGDAAFGHDTTSHNGIGDYNNQTSSSNTSAPSSPPAPVDTTPPAPVDVTPPPAPVDITPPAAPVDVTPPPAPVDITPPAAPVDITPPPAPFDITPPPAPVDIMPPVPVDTTPPAPVDTPPPAPVDITPPPAPVDITPPAAPVDVTPPPAPVDV